MLEQQRDAVLRDLEEGVSPSPFDPLTPQAQKAVLSDGLAHFRLPISDRVIELGVSATEKALNGQELTADEEMVFEAIVVPGKRPVLDVIKGDITPPPPGWEVLAEHRARIRAALPSIGRIDIPGLASIPYAGTGVVVGEGLLMTNRHVAQLFVQGVGAGPNYLRFTSEYSPRLDPRYEVGEAEPGADGVLFEIVAPLLVHPHWDVALLRVRPVGPRPLPPPLVLARHPPPQFGGGFSPFIVVVGYPMLDGRNNLAVQMSVFRQIFGRKRIMPGFLTGVKEITTRWQSRLAAVTHDASTLGGNSGSAVLDPTTGLVLALHFGGEYLVTNYGVPAWELAQDRRIVELGVNFAGPSLPPTTSAAQLGSVWLNAWERVRPLVAEETPTPPAPAIPADGDRPGQTALPVAPDWFERVSDNDLVEAMRRDAPATERLIRQTLLPAEADDLIADLRHGLEQGQASSAEEGIFDFLLGAGKTDPALPEIVFLHGIMGSHLRAHGSLGGRVWLSPLALVVGGVAERLRLADDGERDLLPDQILYPDGHVRMYYEKAARKWRLRGFVVHEFAYDWRKPIINAADRLHLFLETLRLERPAKKFALVAHSMGGLVAALYAARHPEWSARVLQAILLGSPLRGSYAPIEALLGTYPVLASVAMVDLKDTLADYMAAVRTLPGLLDMLPDPEIFPDAAPFYQRGSWPAECAPAQIWLDHSRLVKRLIANSPLLETVRLIVSPGHPTVGEALLLDGRLRPGPQHRRGDGTVPTRSAAAGIAGLTVYRAAGQHADLPREDAVIDAVESLLKNGTCALPPLTREEIEDPTPLEAAMTEAVAQTMTEAATADLALRLGSGIFTQRDAHFLLSSDPAARPGPVGG